MQLAPRDPSRPFVPVVALPAKEGPAPTLHDVHWRDQPGNDVGLVSVRYRGTVDGDPTRFTVRNDPTFARREWHEVRGTLDDAIRAARELAVTEGFEEVPAEGYFGRTSVAVLEAARGAWHLTRMQYTEGMGDGMDARISMPIDRVPASASQVSVPYGKYGHRTFDVPDAVQVRFDDDRVAALVGVDSVALAPGR